MRRGWGSTRTGLTVILLTASYAREEFLRSGAPHTAISIPLSREAVGRVRETLRVDPRESAKLSNRSDGPGYLRALTITIELSACPWRRPNVLQRDFFSCGGRA